MLSILEKEIPKVCPRINNPVNEQVFPVSDGKTFVFTCNTGYTIVGPTLLTCTDRAWSAKEPKCVSAKSFEDAYGR